MEYVLQVDVNFTKRCVNILLRQKQFAVLQTYGQMLEWSCNGIAWLTGTFIFIWLANSESMHQMQFNFLLGLILDILIVAVLKSLFRRRRPTPPGNFTIGADKFSFPSGHASRSVFVLCFFTTLIGSSYVFWPLLLFWCFSVCLSRILTFRHYILDMVGGMVLGVLETLIMSMLWVGHSNSSIFIKYLSDFDSGDNE